MQLLTLCTNNPGQDKAVDKFNKNAIQLLLKKGLKKNPKLIGELENAIKEKRSDSGCIPISSKTERTLLVAHRRCKPQVVYCRLWRWPDIKSHHQIRPVCSNESASKIQDSICINPYHYERIIPEKINPILVPNNRIPPDLSSSIEDSEPRTKSWPARLSSLNHLKPAFHQAAPEQSKVQQSIPNTQTLAMSQPTKYLAASDNNGGDLLTFYLPQAPVGQIYQRRESTSEDMYKIPFPSEENWVTIHYHEYDKQVGERFQSSQTVVHVDSFTAPSSEARFSLGEIENIERYEFAEYIRRRIGHGIRLTYVDGDVYIENLSDSPVFLPDPAKFDVDKGPSDDLVKMVKGDSLKIFSIFEFQGMLKAAVEEGYQSVCKLMPRCIVTVSFVKGWGFLYKRSTLIEAPCWLEIALDGPMLWVNQVLSRLRIPFSD